MRRYVICSSFIADRACDLSSGAETLLNKGVYNNCNALAQIGRRCNRAMRVEIIFTGLNISTGVKGDYLFCEPVVIGAASWLVKPIIALGV